ncbi:hypothetical protein ACW4UO_29730, partial [Klebsiella pneumoniae]
MRDIIAQLGNQNTFYRLRLGIGHPGVASMVSNFVLGRAPRAEQEKLDASIDFALDPLKSGKKINGFSMLPFHSQAPFVYGAINSSPIVSDSFFIT